MRCVLYLIVFFFHIPGNVLNAAHELDVPVPYSAQLYEIMQYLKVHGHIRDDHSGIIQYFEDLADVTVCSPEKYKE